MVDRNPVVDKIKLGARVGGSNVHGNASMYLAIENIDEGDQIFEAPEQLVISQKVRSNWERFFWFFSDPPVGLT